MPARKGMGAVLAAAIIFILIFAAVLINTKSIAIAFIFTGALVAVLLIILIRMG